MYSRQHTKRVMMNPVKYTHGVDSLMLREAHRGDAVDSDSQNGDEQMDTRDPVREKRPGEDDTSIIRDIGHHRTVLLRAGSAVSPVIVHVLDLFLDKAVDALAVRAVGEAADHAQPVGPLLSGKQLLDGNPDPLSPLLVAVGADHFLFQTQPRLDQRDIFCLSPSSL